MSPPVAVIACRNRNLLCSIGDLHASKIPTIETNRFDTAKVLISQLSGTYKALRHLGEHYRLPKKIENYFQERMQQVIPIEGRVLLTDIHLSKGCFEGVALCEYAQGLGIPFGIAIPVHEKRIRDIAEVNRWVTQVYEFKSEEKDAFADLSYKVMSRYKVKGRPTSPICLTHSWSG